MILFNKLLCWFMLNVLGIEHHHCKGKSGRDSECDGQAGAGFKLQKQAALEFGEAGTVSAEYAPSAVDYCTVTADFEAQYDVACHREFESATD